MSHTRTVLWAPWVGPGLEHLRLDISDDEVVADSVVIAADDDAPFRLRYIIRCDAAWRVRALDIDPLHGREGLALRADGEGHWTRDDGAALPALDGCLDVDIAATPFTNTLAIRRMALAPGTSADLAVVYVAVPALELRPLRQRYTCLETGPEGGRYLYEGLDTDFKAELAVDADGLVIDYPETFRRVV